MPFDGYAVFAGNEFIFNLGACKGHGDDIPGFNRDLPGVPSNPSSSQVIMNCAKVRAIMDNFDQAVLIDELHK